MSIQSDDPGSGPACMAAAIRQSSLQSLPCGLHKFWCLVYADRCSGIYSVEVRYMPVTRFLLIVVFKPFLNLTISADLNLRKICKYIFCIFYLLFISIKYLSCFNIISKQLSKYLDIHSRNFTHAASYAVVHYIDFLRWYWRRCDELSFFISYKEVFEESHALIKYIEMLIQKLPVARIQIVLPDMGCHPRFTHNPESRWYAMILRRSICIYISIVVSNRASAAIHRLGSLFAIFTYSF